MERQYVGIDLHRHRTVIVRMDADGEVVGEARIDNSAMALAAEVAKAGPAPEVAIEATVGWYWAVDVLEELGAGVHLAHPLGIKTFENRRVKNDRVDAWLLADLLRMGRLPEAWIAPAPIRESCASWSATATSSSVTAPGSRRWWRPWSPAPRTRSTSRW